MDTGHFDWVRTDQCVLEACDSRLDFMLLLFGKDTRCNVAAVDHAIIETVRLQAVFASLQIKLGVHINHLYRSTVIVECSGLCGT